MIELGEEAHVVVDNIAAWREFAKYLNLAAVKGGHLVRGEATEGQPVCWICLSHRETGQIDLIEASVLH